MLSFSCPNQISIAKLYIYSHYNIFFFQIFLIDYAICMSIKYKSTFLQIPLGRLDSSFCIFSYFMVCRVWVFVLNIHPHDRKLSCVSYGALNKNKMFVSVRMTKLRSICSIILYVIIGFDYLYIQRFHILYSGQHLLYGTSIYLAFYLIFYHGIMHRIKTDTIHVSSPNKPSLKPRQINYSVYLRPAEM